MTNKTEVREAVRVILHTEVEFALIFSKQVDADTCRPMLHIRASVGLKKHVLVFIGHTLHTARVHM